MKRNFKIATSLAALVLSLPATLFAQEFSLESPLRSGNWVKISIPQTGLYEISYDQLREMGFEDPSKVAIVGKGGPQLSLDFATATGDNVYSDSFRPVGVINDAANSKIYFFGQGTESVSYGQDAVSSAKRFLNKGQNIFSRTGAYYLTDTQTPKKILKRGKSTMTAPKLTQGTGYLLHDLDLIQTHHHDGALFWGEDFTKYGADRMQWEARHPDMLSAEAQLQLVFYTEEWLDAPTSYRFGMTGSNEQFSNTFAPLSGDYMTPAINRVLNLTPSAGGGEIFFEIEGDKPSKACHLDYWMLTFPRQIPTLSEGYAQDMIWFPSVTEGIQRMVDAPKIDGVRALQITDSYNISELGAGPTEDTFMMEADADNPALLFFDPSRKQLSISGFSRVENQNLHSLVEEDPELLIITVPHLRHLAERHADVHRNLEGMRVSVAVAPEIYNEFSAGVPDAMAYRALVTYLYKNQQHPLKNILLYGPQLSDLRGMNEEVDPDRYLIALQDPKNHYVNGGYPNYDLYGCVAPTVSMSAREQAQIAVGVGILSVRNENDAEVIRTKVENYIMDQEFVHRINRYISIGGAGDSHIHDSQAIAFDAVFNEMAQYGGINSVVLIDTYGGADARKKMMDVLDEGVLMGIYFGHSTAECLSAYENFFSTTHLQNLKNQSLPFLCLAGCDQTLPDKNTRGIAEALVMDSPNGAIGVIGSTRSAWSGQNMEMFKAFHRLLNSASALSSDTGLFKETPTIGEIYANLKSYLRVNNEHSFILACDPAIKIPIIGRRMAVELDASETDGELRPGNSVQLTGSVVTSDGEVDTDFNGEILVRVMEPKVYIESRNIVSADPMPISIPYGDRQASMAGAKVENGRFSVSVHIPASMKQYAGQELRLVMSAYNPEMRMGGAGELKATVSPVLNSGWEAAVNDSQAPVITSIAYNPERCTIEFEAADNVALNLSDRTLVPGVEVKLDGKVRDQRTVIRGGEGSRSASYEFVVGELTPGDHSVAVSVTDAAGNLAHADLVFNVNPIWGELGLEMEETAADGKATFNVTGLTADSLTLVILNESGNRVFSKESRSANIQWDCLDEAGKPVAPGTYRAYVIENGNSQAKGSSSSLTFTVI